MTRIKKFQDEEYGPAETGFHRRKYARHRASSGIRRTVRILLLTSVFYFLLSGMPAGVLWAQGSGNLSYTPESAAGSTLSQVQTSLQWQLEKSLAELATLREEVAKEKIPLSQKLNDLENQLLEVRREFQQTTRLLDSRTLDLSNLRSEIQSRREEKNYLLNSLLQPYISNFETRLHITEIQRYSKQLESAKLALENDNLSETEVYEKQAALIFTSLERLQDALGGTRFEGNAVDTSGLVKPGTFVLVGPVALYLSQDGQTVGTAEQRLGSLEPTVIGFESEEMAKAAAETVTSGTGLFPFDPTLGNAHKIEAMKETLQEHIMKGGPVMVPILGLAGLALLIAVFKWLHLAYVRNPSERKIRALLQAIVKHDDKENVKTKAKAIAGPTGKMLMAGVEHIEEPSELIEEVMYERVLATKLKLNHFLPFIAISASCAPLLGLLGTVTGIISTFKLITVYGAGDPKTLSSGISEALITTEYGLIVAIPSLLIHAMLSRKVRRVIDRMEKAATSFINQVSKTPYRRDGTADLLAEMPAAVAREVLHSLNFRGFRGNRAFMSYSENSAGSIMDSRVIMVDKNATVAEAIARIREVAIDEDFDTIFVVDERGKYVGDVYVHRLVARPEQTHIGSLMNVDTLSVRVDADRNDVRILFSRPEVNTLPVLDYDGRVVGRITRNGE